MNLDEHMKFAMEQVFVTSDHHFGAWKLASNILRSPIFSQEEDALIVSRKGELQVK